MLVERVMCLKMLGDLDRREFGAELVIGIQESKSTIKQLLTPGKIIQKGEVIVVCCMAQL